MGVVDVFKKLKKANCEDPFGPASEQFNGSGSYGNGAAMRVHPLGLYCYDKSDEFISQETIKSAKVTKGFFIPNCPQKPLFLDSFKSVTFNGYPNLASRVSIIRIFIRIFFSENYSLFEYFMTEYSNNNFLLNKP
jgi:hypothetical protein